MKFLPVKLAGAAFAIFIFSACVSTSIEAVKRDGTISDPATESVAFWNIQLIDLTGTLAGDSDDIIPRIRIRQRNIDFYGSVISLLPASGNSDDPIWVEGEDFTVYDALMCASMEAGDFVMENIRIYPGYDPTGNTSVTIPLERRFRIDSGKLVNLGTIQLIVTAKVGETYQTTTSIHHDIAEPVSQRFSAAFPDIAESFDRQVVNQSTSYFLEEDFETTDHPFPEEAYGLGIEFCRALVDNKEWFYCINRTTDDSQYDLISLPDTCLLDSGSSFEVSWKGAWFSGDDTVPFGLILGKDEDNALFFSGSGNRQAAVFRMEDGEWVDNPLEWMILPSTMPGGADTGDVEYRVEVSRNSVRYLAAGELAAEFPLNMKFRELYVAMYATGVQSVGFDNLLIEEPIAAETGEI